MFFSFVSGGLVTFVLMPGGKLSTPIASPEIPAAPAMPAEPIVPQDPKPNKFNSVSLIATIQNDPDKTKVEKWLKENLDSGKWEEVKWTPCPDVKAICQKHIDGSTASIEQNRLQMANIPIGTDANRVKFDCQENIKFSESIIAFFQGLSKKRYCAMKLRSSNSFGATVVSENLFEINGTSVKLITVQTDPVVYEYAWGFLGKKVSRFDN